MLATTARQVKNQTVYRFSPLSSFKPRRNYPRMGDKLKPRRNYPRIADKQNYPRMGGVMALLFFIGSCSGRELVVLGSQGPATFTFGTPKEVTELSSGEDTGNPTLTADKLEIFLTRSDGAERLIWHATRSSPNQRFDSPTKLSELHESGSEDTSPAISANGLTLWFGSNRDGGKGDMDIWVSTRVNPKLPWGPPVNLVAINSKAKDIPRPLGQYDSIMPMSSDRVRAGMYQIYFAARLREKEFANPKLLSDLTPLDLSHADAFLTHDGLTLFYSQGPHNGRKDLYVAYRKSLEAPFAQAKPLEMINSPLDEFDPWLSMDGKELYFSSNRSGRSLIYVAPVARTSSPRDAQSTN